MKEAVFMLGLPGAGKTSAMYNFIRGRNFQIVSADEIREQHSAYDSKHPDLIHEECVKLAEQEMIKFIDKDQELILMDGGLKEALNELNKIITYLKKNYHVDTI